MLELKPVVNLRKSPTSSERITADTLVRIDTQHLVMPAWIAHQVTSEAVVLNYDYVTGGRIWRINKNQDISTEVMSQDQLLALRIAEKLEN